MPSQRDHLTARARRMLESPSDGVCEIDATGTITYITTRGAQLLGASVESLTGKPLHQTIHPPSGDGGSLTSAECGLCRSLQSGEPQRELKSTFWHASGRALPVTCSIVPIATPAATQGGAVIAFSDDSERQLAEQAIARLTQENADAERRQTEFIAILSHELRNPLAPIRTGLQLMRKAGSGDASMVQLRDIMERQVAHLVRLVDDLMDIARITSGRIVLKKERVALQDILSHAMDASAALLVEANNPLSVEIPDDPLYLNADGTRLTQVFTNLLNNASQYSASGDPISLRVLPVGGNVQVSIADRGIGIGPEALHQIFEMFSTASRDADGTRAGLGIGLNLARRLVELHDGALVATSGGLGQGSDFVVTLPLAEPASLDAAGAAASPASGVQLVRALIVDDNVDAAESLSLLLKFEGHTTAIACTGPEALAKVAEFKPDIVLLDIGLPGMNGYDVARAIRALPEPQRAIFLVAITGWGSEEDRRRSTSAGFDEHLTKPVDISMLELVLTTLRSRDVAVPAVAEPAEAAARRTQEDHS